MNKKGIYPQYVVLVVMGIAIVVIMLLWWFFSLLAPPITNAVGIGVRSIQGSVAGDGNISRAVNITIVPVNNALDNLTWLAYTLPIVLFLAFIMMCFYVRTYPFLLPIWLAICGVLVIISIILSVGYADSVGNNGAYSAYSANTFFISYLPYIISAVGIVGGIVLLVLISKDSSAEVII